MMEVFRHFVCHFKVFFSLVRILIGLLNLFAFTKLVSYLKKGRSNALYMIQFVSINYKLGLLNSLISIIQCP